MPRNLDRRVEIVFPIEDEALQAKAMHILEMQLADTEKAHILQTDGTYERVDRRGKTPVNSQKLFGDEAVNALKNLENADRTARVFVPERRILDTVDRPVESFITVNGEPGPSRSQVGMIIRSEKQVENTILS